MRDHAPDRSCRTLVLFVFLSAVVILGGLSVAHAQMGKPEGLYYKSWGVVIGIDHFGASAPADVLYREFGFTQDAK